MKVNLIPMAGVGSRFANAGYTIPKPLIEVDGIPMISRAINSMPEAEKWIFPVSASHLFDYNLESVIRSKVPNAVIIPVEKLTLGGAATCLLAEGNIDPADTVYISACDIAPSWNQEKFWQLIGSENPDCVSFGFKDDSRVLQNPEKYSWIKQNRNGEVESISVKTSVSTAPMNDLAIVGSFFFGSWDIFKRAANKLIEKGAGSAGEFHVEGVVNEVLEEGGNALPFRVDEFICWGTPEELEEYLKGGKNE